MKKIIISLAAIGMMFYSSSAAFAEQQIGYVDVAKILNGYSKAQEINSKVKDQQFEIQRMITSARNEVLAVKSKKEREELEKKLTEKINQKSNSFSADYEKNVQTLNTNIFESVRKVADDKKIDFVFKKENIIIGGQDITDDVLAELNK